jgi:hypothetical protein
VARRFSTTVRRSYSAAPTTLFWYPRREQASRRTTTEPGSKVVQTGEPLSSFAPLREHVERLDVGRRKTSAIRTWSSNPLH